MPACKTDIEALKEILDACDVGITEKTIKWFMEKIASDSYFDIRSDDDYHSLVLSTSWDDEIAFILKDHEIKELLTTLNKFLTLRR